MTLKVLNLVSGQLVEEEIDYAPLVIQDAAPPSPFDGLFWLSLSGKSLSVYADAGWRLIVSW